MCFVIDVRFESLEALRFKGACFVIDFRCERIKATIFMGVSCLIDLFLRQVAKHQKKCDLTACACPQSFRPNRLRDISIQ